MPDEKDDAPLFELTAEELAELKKPTKRGGGWTRRPFGNTASWAHNELRLNKIDVRKTSTKRGDVLGEGLAETYADYDPAYDHFLKSWKFNQEYVDRVVEELKKKLKGKPQAEVDAAIALRLGPDFLTSTVKEPLTSEEIEEALSKAPPELTKDKPIAMRAAGQLKFIEKLWKYRSFKYCCACSTFYTKLDAYRWIRNEETGQDELVPHPKLIGKVKQGTYMTYESRNSAETSGVVYWCYECGAKDNDVTHKKQTKCPKCGLEHSFTRQYDRATRGTISTCENCGFRKFRSRNPEIEDNLGTYTPPSIKEARAKPKREAMFKKLRAARLHNVLWCLRHNVTDPIAIANKLREYGDSLVDAQMVVSIQTRIANIIEQERKK